MYTINKIDEFEQSGLGDIDAMNMNMDSDFDADDQNTDLFTVGRKVKISLADMDYISWRHYLKKDAETLEFTIFNGRRYYSGSRYEIAVIIRVDIREDRKSYK